MTAKPKVMTYIPAGILQQFAQEVFQALGTPPDDAAVCADVLIASDRRGIESHGIGRLKVYYDRIRAGVQQVETKLEIVKETETTAVIDGHHGMGAVIAHRCMQLAMEKAQQYGLGATTARNSTHFGIAGYYALMAVARGMIGMAVTNARPIVPPTFGSERMLGTNPIAFAAPSDMEFPFCFDAATSVVSRGKIEVLARAEKPTPTGWVVNRDGEPLTDSAAILRNLANGTALMLPLGGAGEALGGYKGYGLSTIVEILSAGLCDGAYTKDLLGFAPDGSRRPYMLGHFFLAIDVEHFVPLPLFRRITGEIMRALHNSKKAPGKDRIYVAGEKEYERERVIRRQGVPINANLLRNLRIVRDELSISGYESFL